MTIDEVKEYCRANKLVIVSQELYEQLISEHFMMTGNAPAEETEIPPTITATYNGYTGIAYGRSSYEIRDKDNTMVFHTGSLMKRPMTKDECFLELKDTLAFLEQLRQQDREG